MRKQLHGLEGGASLMVSEAQLDYCVESIRSVIESVHSSKVFWIDALNLGRRTMSL